MITLVIIFNPRVVVHKLESSTGQILSHAVDHDTLTTEAKINMALYHIKRFNGWYVRHIVLDFQKTYFCTETNEILPIEDEFDEILSGMNGDFYGTFGDYMLEKLVEINVWTGDMLISLPKNVKRRGESYQPYVPAV